jgi:hypothetical protein
MELNLSPLADDVICVFVLYGEDVCMASLAVSFSSGHHD